MIMMYPRKPVTTQMRALPTNIRSEPIPVVILNLPALRTMRKNVPHAAEQKFSLVKAI
jgi:hypothetical protein